MESIDTCSSSETRIPQEIPVFLISDPCSSRDSYVPHLRPVFYLIVLSLSLMISVVFLTEMWFSRYFSPVILLVLFTRAPAGPWNFETDTVTKTSDFVPECQSCVTSACPRWLAWACRKFFPLHWSWPTLPAIAAMIRRKYVCFHCTTSTNSPKLCILFFIIVQNFHFTVFVCFRIINSIRNVLYYLFTRLFLHCTPWNVR